MGAITLQFSTMNDAGSLAIRFYDHGPFSHVDTVLGDGSLLGARDDVFGGKPAGVQIRPPGYASFSSVERVCLPCSEDQQISFQSFAANQIGKPYDETAIMGFVLGRNWREPDSWFCSELVAAAMEQSKILPYPLVSGVNKITPNMLYLACSVLTNVNA